MPKKTEMRLVTKVVPKDLPAYINEKLKRWTFDRLFYASSENSIPTEAELSDSSEGLRLSLARLVLGELEDVLIPARLLDEPTLREIVGWYDVNTSLSIGGNSHDATEDITKWVHSEIAFVLLGIKAKKDINPVLLGFATAKVADTDNAVEIGRLLVSPQHRKQGLGQVFISNIAQLISSVSKGAPIYARVPKSNPRANDMFEDIGQFEPTNLDDDAHVLSGFPKSPEYPLLRNDWFRWNFIPVREPTSFGKLFKALREERGLTQQTVAQRAGISREALNQIERDGTPSNENLPRLLQALSLNKVISSEAKTRLLYSLYGYDIPRDIVFANSFEQSDTSALSSESRWTLSDRPVELVDSQEFERTVDAILRGYYRYFFIPRAGLGAPYGISLCRSLAEAVALRSENAKRRHQGLSRLRLYVAPSSLCRLRIVMYGAEVHNGRATSPRGVSLAGPSDERIPLSSVQASRVFDDLCDAIRPSFHSDSRLNVRMTLNEGFEFVPMAEIYETLED